MLNSNIKNLIATDSVAALVNTNVNFFNFVFDSVCNFKDDNFGTVYSKINNDLFVMGFYVYTYDEDRSILIVKDIKRESVKVMLAYELFTENFSNDDILEEVV